VLEIGGISLTNSVPDLRVLFIAKLDPDGNGLWATASGIPIGVRDAYARGHRVVADAQRNVFVAGIFRSSMVLGGTTLTANTEKADIFIAKFDRAGSPVWLRQLGAKAKANDDLALGLAVDLSGDAHIAGRFGDKIFLGKYSSNGDLIWFKPVSSSAPSQGSGIAVDDKQNIFITGGFTGSAVFAGNFISKGAGDFFVGMLTELPPVSVFLDNQWITKSVVVKPGSTKVAIQTTYPNGSLFYSLDGSSPTFASLAYSAPFLLTNSATVRVLAYSADFAKSAQSEPIEVKIIPTFKITALETGGGRVEVTPAMDRYVLGSEIVARAVSSNGWSFIRWTGDATGDGESVTMAVNTNKSIGAIFGTPLTTTVSGEGTININPTLSLYPFGSTVRLWAVPKPGFYFGAWGNAARGSTNPLLIQITDARPSVAALFALLGSEQVTLTAVVDGDGQISVEPPANVYTRGQVVTLTAKPDGDKEFLLWTGDMMSSVNPTSLRLDSSKSVRGHFGRRPVITAARFDSNGRFFASILSDIGRIVQIESSADCLTWLPVVLLTNTVGTLGFSDRAQIDSSHFYRARLMLK